MDNDYASGPSFYTLSSNNTDEQNMTSPLPTPPSATHDTSRSDYHLKDFSEFVKALNQSAQRAFPNTARSYSRYTSIQVLLLRWEQDDLNVEPELTDLRRVFEKYQFGTETWLIPTKHAHRRLMLKAGQFVDKHESKDCLMIVYYGGHAFINEARQSTWSCTRSRQYSSVDWSAVQTLFESATSDVLLLLDCCAAASSAPKSGTALTETIAACGWESIAAEPGRFSFTSALIEVLEEWINRKFSVAMLHSRILSVLKHERPELLGGSRRIECRRTPIYIVTTENPEVPSIMLSRMLPPLRPDLNVSAKRSRDDSQEPDEINRRTTRGNPKRRRISSPMDYVSQSRKELDTVENQSVLSKSLGGEDVIESSTLPQVPSPPEEYDIGSLHAITPDGNLKLPHVLISVALVEDQDFNFDACGEWFASFPALAQYATVQSVYRSCSTLLIVSLPVFVWDLLPGSPACSFLAYVRSDDILTKKYTSQGNISPCTKKNVITPAAPHRDTSSIWRNQIFVDGEYEFPIPRPSSRTPSVPRSISGRSMSPTSGNPMRFRGDRSFSHSDMNFASPQEKSTRISNQNPTSKSMEAIQSQAKSRNSGLQVEIVPNVQNVLAKKSRTNTPWTPAEERRLKTMRDAGKSWADIAKNFPSRTEGSVKKHWYKDMHYAKFAEDESQALLDAIKEYETNKWKVIGMKAGKPAKACEQYAKEHFQGSI